MPHVSVHYKIYLPGGHHRQPRNTSAELEPNPPSEVDVTNPGNITPLNVPQLPFISGGNPELAQMLFWSVTDGTNGQTFPAGSLTVPVGANPLVITAWYLPIGVGVPGEPGTAIIDDAFSAAKGDFIDDTFVTVTPDGSLTSDANVIGVVSTAKDETLHAAASVTSTTEPFSKWLSYGAGTPSGSAINVPAGSDGMAIAVYERSHVVLNPQVPAGGRDAIYGTIIGGVAVDGGGAIIINGVPHPVDPWGPLMVALAQASLVSAGSRSFAGRVGANVRALTAQSVAATIKNALPAIEKEAGSV